ncbi:MAG: ftsY [Rhodospirillaceae bacterium]|nr:MAG: ftsY [Rhodospirillaceae bacterium]
MSEVPLESEGPTCPDTASPKNNKNKKKGWLAWLRHGLKDEPNDERQEEAPVPADTPEGTDTVLVTTSRSVAEPPSLEAPAIEKAETYFIGEVHAFAQVEAAPSEPPDNRERDSVLAVAEPSGMAMPIVETPVPPAEPPLSVLTPIEIGEALAVSAATETVATKTDVMATAATEDNQPVPAKNWFQRLKEGLSRSSNRLTQGIVNLFTKRCLDDQALEELEELLISTDLGVNTAARLVANLAKTRFNQKISPQEVQATLAADITRILEPVAQPLVIDRAFRPYVILVVGVNGSGKTTTIGKMARQFHDQKLRVSLAAGDTFRAAAAEQLEIWGKRSNCPVVARTMGADAAGLAFDALNEARARGDDVLLIDTAGRLQNKAHLMAELQKIVRVLRKLEPAVPHACLLVLDATVGQNAHAQVEIFQQMTNVSGLVVTKLDGTARGGVLVALAEKFNLPVHYVGIGEKVEDLRPFSAHDFARGLLGLDAG